MRVKGIIASAGKFTVAAPSITINSTTNFNQDRATFNATVNPNGATTSVKFQYKKNADSVWTDGATISGLTGGSQSVYSNQTGLTGYGTTGGIYNVRAIATSSVDTITSGSTSFTTWSIKTYTKSTSGTDSLTVPTITPTGGSAIAPSVYSLLVIGAGGGASIAGGGGGTYSNPGTVTCSSGTSTTINISVGAGGTAGTWTGAEESSTNGGAGGASQVSGAITTYTANGGGGGSKSVFVDTGYGGSSGSGNPGGAAAIFVSKSTVAYAGGGGGGQGGAGGNATANSDTTGYGGQGGAGVVVSGYTLGGGGYGAGTNGTYGQGANYGGYGYGGNYVTAGAAGLVTFTYYGP
jgi:hypothetical protein